MRRLVLSIILTMTSFVLYANEANDLIEKKPAEYVRVVFTQLLKQSNLNCGDVTKTQYRGIDEDNQAYWYAGCEDENNYIIRLPNDPKEAATIIECDAFVKQGIKCFDEDEAS